MLTVAVGGRETVPDAEALLDTEGDAEDDRIPERLLELTADLVTLLDPVLHLDAL